MTELQKLPAIDHTFWIDFACGCRLYHAPGMPNGNGTTIKCGDPNTCDVRRIVIPVGLPSIAEVRGEQTRVETGVVQFDDDWPGVFIRGDVALMGCAPAVARAIEIVLGDMPTAIDQQIIALQLKGLLDLLQSCNAANFR